MFSLAAVSFVSGILTVLAPCVLPLLPIIIGSSVSAKSWWKPYLVTLGLVISITIFTILLKATTLLISIDPNFWKYISGGIIIGFGLIYIFPELWNNISIKLNLSGAADKNLDKASQKDSPLGSLIVGAALGPVFASCSPTYFLIIATILPVSFFEGLVYIIIYGIGLASIMLAISLLGRQLVVKLRVFANPNGWFKKSLGIIFILVGIGIIAGLDKTLQTNLLSMGIFDITLIEQNILDSVVNNP